MNNSPTTIIGGGIAGLAGALALGTRETLIIEQAKSFSAAGAGLQLGPNAVRALQNLGAWDAVEPATSSPPEIHMRDGVTGKTLKRLQLGATFEKRFNAPYRVIQRADLHAALLQVIKSKSNIQLNLGEAIVAVENQRSGVQIKTDKIAFTANSAIITDGVNSLLRQHLVPDTPAIASGSLFHRAMLRPPDITGIDYSNVNVWLYPQGHVVHYLVGATQNLNLIAITPQTSIPEAHFKYAAPALRSLLEFASPSFTIWPGLYVKPFSTWHIDNILLLGDAAHATLPYLAQGAAMALEDAACLANVVATTHSIKHAFSETARRRMGRTSRLHAASLAAGKTYHLDGPQRLARNLSLQILPGSIVQSRLRWIYKG